MKLLHFFNQKEFSDEYHTTFLRNRQLFSSVWDMDVHTVPPWDEVLLKKRTLVESVIRELKTQMQVEHSRQRSIENFQVNVFSALIAYQLLEKKPTLNLAELQEVSDLPVIF